MFKGFYIERGEIYGVSECLKGVMWTMSGKGLYVVMSVVEDGTVGKGRLRRQTRLPTIFLESKLY